MRTAPYSSTHPPQLLAAGWSDERVMRYRRERAEELVDKGVTWESLSDETLEEATHLVRANVRGVRPTWSLDKDGGGIVAMDKNGQVIAVVVLGGGAIADGDVALIFIRHIAVAPQWRGAGVGTVSLGMVPTVVREHTENARDVAFLGSCAPEAARFYQRCGYTVLQAGEVAPLPSLETGVTSDDENYPCPFIKGVDLA